MNLIIDVGNSTAKVGIFDQHDLVEKRTFSDEEKLKAWIETHPASHAIISSVSKAARHVAAIVKNEKCYLLHHALPLPIINHYSTPTTLGVDRLAGVCGAIELFKETDTLVIDAGTCITYDFVDKQKNYFGGSISPGLKMRFKAVHTFTAKLPLVDSANAVGLIGDSTESSIQSGVINGMIAEIEGIIMRYQDKYPGLRVILCGGDTAFFENKLKASIFAAPDLVLIGLNSILIYNVNR